MNILISCMKWGIPLKRSLIFRHRIPKKIIPIQCNGQIIEYKFEYTMEDEVITDTWSLEYMEPELLVGVTQALSTYIEKIEAPLHGATSEGGVNAGGDLKKAQKELEKSTR